MQTTSASVSEARLAANRANAQHSTGPRTPEGKATSARNSVRHGFTGTFTIFPGESEEAFDSVCHQYRQEYQPQTVTEYDLVNDMARHWWLAQRAIMLQDTVLPHCVIDPAYQKLLALYIRYQTTNERAFHKCLDTLLKLRKYRAQEARVGSFRRNPRTLRRPRANRTLLSPARLISRPKQPNRLPSGPPTGPKPSNPEPLNRFFALSLPSARPEHTRSASAHLPNRLRGKSRLRKCFVGCASNGVWPTTFHPNDGHS